MAERRTRTSGGAPGKVLPFRLSLVRPKADPATVAAMRELLELAISGRLLGVSCSYWDRQDGEDHIVSGIYRDQPSQAVRAALRASMILVEREDPRRPT